MTFNGVFYLEPPVSGRVRGAVFLGKGTFSAAAPPVEFEVENLRRLLKVDRVESDFQTAVLRFSDDTDSELGTATAQEPSPADVRRLAEKWAPELLKETGANVPARVALSILNGEKPGVFCATFDKGRLGRFTYVLDQEGRLPSAVFGVNAGESGLIFANRDSKSETDIWLAFHCLDDYTRGLFQYSDTHNIVAIRHYDMEVDLHESAKKKLGVKARMDIDSLAAGIQAVPFSLNEGLSLSNSERLKRALRVTSVHLGAIEVPFAQEDWETGFTVFLPSLLTTGQKFTLSVEYAGDFMLIWAESEVAQTPPSVGLVPVARASVYYPLVNTTWYPRHGYWQRSTFQLTFHGKPRDDVAGPGNRSESSSEGERITRYSQETPVAFVTFAGGEFRRNERRDQKGIAFEYYSVPGDGPEFRLNELQNSLTYFGQLFGPYPYPVLRGVYHPRPFGQGFPTMLLLAPTAESFGDLDNLEHSFVAHETAHQWWGGMVGWRSYRDQWLSEAFAEYSGEIYTAARLNPEAGRDLIRRMRLKLQLPPAGEIAVYQGKVAEIGPIVLGSRLATRETLNAYQALIYEKGALILRMLQFLLSDPQTGDDKAFFEMLKEFVQQNNGRAATTDDFRNLASAYFQRSPIGQQYSLKDLNWFFRQWVYEAHFPSYRMEYRLEDQTDGSVLMRGAIHQENAGEKWFMPLPVIVHFGKNKFVRSVLYAYGEQKEFAVKLPAKPSSVQLDPYLWILSDSTTATQVH